MNKQILMTFISLIMSFSFVLCEASPWPEGKTDTIEVEKNTPITIAVLANDIGTGLKVSFVDGWTDKAGQTVADNTKTNIIYTPEPNFIGQDSFWYDFVDDQGRSDYAVVNVTVIDGTNPPPPDNNVWPTGTPDSATTEKNKAIYLSVLSNDIGNNLKVTELDPWTDKAGQVSLNAEKTIISYTPDTNFTGTDTFWYSFADNQNREDYAEVKVTVTGSTRFSHVQMHYGLLNNQAMIWGEIGSAPPYTSAIRNIILSNVAAKGDSQLKIQNNAGLVKNQLITYLATNGEYYVGQVKKLINTDTIELVKPLEAAIASGNKAWNFYGNPSHPNKYGYRAIADFTIRSFNLGTNTQGKHLLLGDSWFDNDHFSAHISQKLPNATIINKGIGGHTTQDLLNRFDADVTPSSPDYVWIISGTNDYWKGITTTQFKSNLNTLLNKSKAIGAKVILIDSSVGESVGPTGIDNKLQSEEYANAVLELNQAQ